MDQAIDKQFFNVTVKLLSFPTLRTISTLLNPIKFIPTKEHLSRDWKGLAVLIGCNSEELSLFNSSPDPTLSVLKKWWDGNNSSIIKLLLHFQKLDRYDIFDDVLPLMISDINNYIAVKNSDINNVDTSLFITLKDRDLHQDNLPLRQYDAFILYADEDAKFAAEIVTVLEEKYKLEIYVKERDLIGGTVELDATMKIIANRCKRLIIILSPAFLESSENKYFMSFAQSIGIEQRQRKIIPCIYKNCTIPVELKPLHKLNYTRSGIFGDFFEKLYSSIISVNGIPTRSIGNTAPCSVPNSVNSYSVPAGDFTSLKERNNSMPDISENQCTVTQENDTDVISTITISNSKSSKKSNLLSYVRKKMLKKKPKAIMA